jgi:uncharacterized protein (TIGR02246 family)
MLADECQVKSCALCNEPAEPGDRFCAACGSPIVEITRATKPNELIDPATGTVAGEPDLCGTNPEDSEGPISASTLDCIEANLARLIKLSQTTTRSVTVVTRTGAQQAESEASIRSIVAAQVVAWDAGDGHAYARHLAADMSFTNLLGTVMYGASAFAQQHGEILATLYRGTTKHHRVHRIRFLTPDVAIVDIDNEVHGVTAMPEGITVPPDGIVKTQLMEVFVRRDDRWWIEAYHSVDVKPAGDTQASRSCGSPR